MLNKVYSGILAGLFLSSVMIFDAVAIQQDNQKKTLIITDFDSKEEKNNIDGGGFAVWEKNPHKENRSCQFSFFEPGRDDCLYCLRLEYDVKLPNSPYGGFCILFDDLDLTQYRKFSFWVKGDKLAGYTSYFKVEFKNEKENSSVIVYGVSDEWRQIEIPLSKFNIKDWAKITEFVIIFEDKEVSRKKGAIYIDDIAVIK